MTLAGNIYGVVLNDAEERKTLDHQFAEKPYAAPPIAPVVYMKPLASVVDGPVPVPGNGLRASTTLAVLIARDTGGVAAADVGNCIGATALALDLAIPSDSYYRPAVAQKNGDDTLALGSFSAPHVPAVIRLYADGDCIHEWSLDRLVRPVEQLVADLGTFMTLKAGDLLLIGLPGDAPTIAAGSALRIEADGLPPLAVATQGEAV